MNDTKAPMNEEGNDGGSGSVTKKMEAKDGVVEENAKIAEAKVDDADVTDTNTNNVPVAGTEEVNNDDVAKSESLNKSASTDNADKSAAADDASSSTTTKPATTTTSTATAAAVAAAATSTRSGFFSRMGSLGRATSAGSAASDSSNTTAATATAAATATSIFGDVYDRAQKRAMELKEQAANEVERLRAQREAAAQAALQEQQQQEVYKYDIPPATGTLVVGSPVQLKKLNVDDGKEKAQVKDTKDTKEAPTLEVAPSDVAQDLKSDDASSTNGSVKQQPASPLRKALNVALNTGSEAAKELVFPFDAFESGSVKNNEGESGSHHPSQSIGSNNSNHDYDSSYSRSQSQDSTDAGSAAVSASGVASADAEEDDQSSVAANGDKIGDAAAAHAKLPNTPTRSNNSTGTNNTSADVVSPLRPKNPAATATASLTPTRFSVATSALMGRYRKLKESASFDSSPLPPPKKERAASPLLVGGMDRVGGLRNFQLEGIFGSDTGSTGTGGGMSSLVLPPSLPLKTDLLSESTPGRDNLTAQTGGQWTTASNRGTISVPTSSATTASLTNTDAPSIAATSDTGSVNSEFLPPSTGSVTTNRRLPPSGKSSSKRTSSSHYEDAVRSVLQPGQRALFFGKGTMGVVLKPTYLASWRGKDGQGLLSPSITTGAKRGGVFIDSLVPGGHAEKSGVVFAGDHVVKIGAVNVEHMTLEEVVSVIQETKRPNIMMLTSEHDVDVVDRVVVDGSSNDDGEAASNNGEGVKEVTKKGFVSPLEFTIGFVNKLVADEGDFGSDEKVSELQPTISRNSLLDDDDEDEDSLDNINKDEEVCFASPGKSPGKSVSKVFRSPGNEAGVTISLNAVPQSKPETDVHVTPGGSIKPDCSTRYDIDTLLEYAPHRTNTPNQTQNRTLLLKRAALFNSDFRNGLRLSLSECICDPRRYSFLEHHFKNYHSKKQSESDKDAIEATNDVTSSKNQRRLLELYLELTNFHDAMMVCSESDREKMLDYARHVSTLFLSDDGAEQNNTNCLPKYVAHVALGGTEKVQAVRFALRDEDDFFEGDDTNCDGFDHIRSSLEAFLSTQESFLSFLISDDCARMRAYLRGSSPFLCVEPRALLKSSSDGTDPDVSVHHNFLLHAILHLVCMKEDNTNEGSIKDKDEAANNFIRNDALLLSSGKRNTGSASLLSCAIFIMRTLQKTMKGAVEGLIEDGMMTGGGSSDDNNMQLYSSLVEDVQFLWEVFISPACGALSTLSLSSEAQGALDATRRLFVSSIDGVLNEESKSFADEDNPSVVELAKLLSSSDVSTTVHSLAEALLREYTVKIYPNFRRHIFHEWACREAKEDRYDADKDHLSSSADDDEYLVPCEFNGLSKGWMNRFLRQMEFPNGISLHRPCPAAFLPKETGDTSSSSSGTPLCFHNADVALVFGSDTEDGLDDEAGGEASAERNHIRRFSCVSLPRSDPDGPNMKGLLAEDVPPIFESYAVVPPFHERPFQGMLQDERNNRLSMDGWEVSLTNFVIPAQSSGTSDEDKWMYCVSLVFRKSSTSRPQISEQEVFNECIQELHHDGSACTATTASEFESPIFTEDAKDGKRRKMKVSQELKEFNTKLQERKWSQRVGQDATVGLALISSRNVTQAMRETLSLLYNDMCSFKTSCHDRKSPQHLCQTLVDILGALSHTTVEATTLSCLLDPYLTFATSKWIQRPLSDQSDIFSEAAGAQLLQTLPPVPLALAFVALLLEQKVVFSSSKRGLLMSASFAMMQLLKPLKWAHLHVPLVPGSMMNELIHYPAPFVLGIPTDEIESSAILGTLPNDVTLVDLDVGRVILASVFNDASKSTEGTNGEVIAGALRSQVLFLAESLGGAFGAAIYRNSWCVDSPLQVIPSLRSTSLDQRPGDFLEVLNICRAFSSELLSGIHSCCMWIEETHEKDTSIRNESAIIFDEDRFFHIKNLRAEGRYLPLIQKSLISSTNKFSLSLDHFDLIYETFLRTQCLSTYISDGDKIAMSFC